MITINENELLDMNQRDLINFIRRELGHFESMFKLDNLSVGTKSFTLSTSDDQILSNNESIKFIFNFNSVVNNHFFITKFKALPHILSSEFPSEFDNLIYKHFKSHNIGKIGNAKHFYEIPISKKRDIRICVNFIKDVAKLAGGLNKRTATGRKRL